MGYVALVLAVSAAPVSELRGGIPLALSLGFSPEAAFLLALLGNLVPMPAVLVLVPRAVRWAARWPGPWGRMGRAYLDWQARRHRLIVRWGPPALALLVAIPLPGTGLWTGALAAALLGIPGRRAVLPLTAGVILAGILVLLASLGVLRLFGR